MGELAGKYTVHTDPKVSPAVHPHCRLPIALQDTFKSELDAMVEKKIMVPVTEPTPWVLSMVAVQKKNNKLRICLDPRDLNRAIMCSHYPLLKIE